MDGEVNIEKEISTRVTAVVGCFFDKEGNILAVQNERGWDLPGGHIEKREGIIEALIREASEEAGAKVTINRLIKVVFPEVSEKKYQGKGIAFFMGNVKSFDPERSVLISPEEFLRRYQQKHFKLVMKEIIDQAVHSRK